MPRLKKGTDTIEGKEVPEVKTTKEETAPAQAKRKIMKKTDAAVLAERTVAPVIQEEDVPAGEGTVAEINFPKRAESPTAIYEMKTFTEEELRNLMDGTHGYPVHVLMMEPGRADHKLTDFVVMYVKEKVHMLDNNRTEPEFKESTISMTVEQFLKGETVDHFQFKTYLKTMKVAAAKEEVKTTPPAKKKVVKKAVEKAG